MNTVLPVNDSILSSDTNKRLCTRKEQENNVFINTMSINNPTKKVCPGDVNPEQCVISKVLNATIHPLVSSFFGLGNDRIIARYKSLNPQIDANVLRNCLEYEPKFYKWAATDFFNVIDSNGKRQMIIVESGSSPAGQEAMPLLDINKRHNGYKFVTQTAFKQALKDADPSLGELAIVCDVASDEAEATGYAAAISEETKEHVWIVMLYDVAKYEQLLKWENRVLYIKDQDEVWHPIRACFNRIAYKPWTYFPLNSKTVVFNNTISCLAGGHNKIMASKSFELFNTELSGSGLAIRFPKTVCNINKSEIFSCIEKMGGHAVIKSPYGSCGHGVYTITNPEELKKFFDANHHYEKFIVQSLVGSASWYTKLCPEKYYHIGTVSNCHNQTFVNDLRMMVSTDETGFHPVVIVSRRARDSWKVFGTNISVKLDSSWVEEHERLITVDQKEFDITGFGIDDLIDAYVQTVLSIIAIDKMCQKLFVNNEFSFELYRTLNPDDVLLDELLL
ncbi:21653_t:CDS:2 [Cetraspora pellucida]|uniref:21653_t:CDS:1 n=1 Tax=Cetraspora pellucida TaxID=1433469 RepID=A0A9N8ZL33_9GLOM|nr:21653_t:CDS:2 [Cetraspora pellucida]